MKPVPIIVALLLGSFFMSSRSNTPPEGNKEKIFFDAVVLMEQEYYEQAKSRLDSVLILDSAHSKAYLMRGICLQQMEADSLALQDFYSAMKIEPENPEVIYFLAEAYQKRRIWDSVLKYYSLTASLDKNSIKSQRGILRAYGETERWEECQSILDNMETQGFQGPEIQFYKGVLAYRKGDSATAKKEWIMGLEMDKSYGPCGFWLGELYFSLEEYDSSLSSVSSVDPGTLESPSRFYLLKARNKLAKRDTLMALIDLNESLHMDPTNAEAYFFRAPVKAFFGDSSGACDDLNHSFSGQFSSDSSLYFLYNCGNK